MIDRHVSTLAILKKKHARMQDGGALLDASDDDSPVGEPKDKAEAEVEKAKAAVAATATANKNKFLSQGSFKN